MPRARLIVFEGADGVGKTELARRTASLLSSTDSHFKYLPFPGRAEGSLGSLIYTLHHKPKELGVSRMTPAALQTLHVAAHLDGLETLLLPSLESGTSFVLDRFWWSTIVYGRVDGVPEETLSALLRLERLGWKNVLPSVVFLISRQAPLRAEPLMAWRRTVSAYQLIAQEEEGRYPIARIENDEEPESAIGKIVALLDSLGLSPQF